MSFRKEEKLHFSKSQLHNLLAWIFENDGYKLYDNRIVSSTYFDNTEMQMFNDSEEGCVPRKKIIDIFSVLLILLRNVIVALVSKFVSKFVSNL
jgi:hypothetical protein